MGLRYRAYQFWNALAQKPDAAGLQRASQALSPELMSLFLQMQPSEQSHSIQIYDRLIQQGETDPALLVAALLHDVGKSRYPLRLWERVLIVVAYRLFPDQARAWGQGEPRGWQRALVVAAQHPAWGAHMARQAGASVQVVSLIDNHQDKMKVDPSAGYSQSREDLLLLRLQAVDDES